MECKDQEGGKKVHENTHLVSKQNILIQSYHINKQMLVERGDGTWVKLSNGRIRQARQKSTAIMSKGLSYNVD